MWLCDKGGKCFMPDCDCEHKVYFDTHNLQKKDGADNE